MNWNRATRGTTLALFIIFAPVSVAQQTQSGPKGKAQRPAAVKAERALTNADVVKMVKVGLGDDVIIAKIKGAPTEALDVSTDGLVALKEAGVSQPVIEAAMKRAGNQATSTLDSSPGTVPTPVRIAESATVAVSDPSTTGSSSPVFLISGGRSKPLEPVLGKARKKLIFNYIDFDGRGALVKEGASQLKIRIRSAVDVRGVYFLVRCDVLEEKGVRTFKVGGKSRLPDEDFAIPTDVQKDADGTWVLTPAGSLDRGEYGIFTSRAEDRPGAPDSLVLYEFGIDGSYADRGPAVALPVATAVPSGPSLTNSDVIAMAKAELGDDVITAKIQQAPNESLDVATESLIALKKAGVSKAVVSAMIRRVEQRNTRGGASASAAAPASQVSNPNRPVSLVVRGAPVVIEPVAGVLRRINAYFSIKVFLDFTGPSASVRTAERTPTVLIQSDLNPAAQFWIVKPKILEEDGVRTLKIGSMKGALAPDEDWTVPTTVRKVSEGVWEMTSKEELDRGEYGVFRMGAFNTVGSDLLFGFVVE